ncbi:hypothetical protein [Acidocella facilis]|uniref:hypothetical protein n=1 Tax=Acidocella facilis TaxID=525 RepID=UPI00047D3A54|nr:hypothetical protein [Acidocella facilis]
MAEDLDWWTLHARDALFWTLDDLQELNGLVARAHYLIANPPGPTGNATPPGGGSAGSGHATITPMRIAA